MVVEEDYSFSSSTQLPSQHVLRYRGWHELEEDQLGQRGVECSTVPDTPLPNHHQFTLSPVRQGLDATSSHPYFLHSTPERIVASGHRVASQGDGVGRAVAAGGFVAGGVAGDGVVAGGAVAAGGFVAGRVVGDGVVAVGAVADVVAAGGVGVVTGGRGGRTRRGAGRRMQQSSGRQAAGNVAGGIACGV
jgi:hypothetical protein